MFVASIVLLALGVAGFGQSANALNMRDLEVHNLVSAQMRGQVLGANTKTLTSAGYTDLVVTVAPLSASGGNISYQISWARKRNAQGSLYIYRKSSVSDMVLSSDNAGQTGSQVFAALPSTAYVVRFYKKPNKQGGLLISKTFTSAALSDEASALLSSINGGSSSVALGASNNSNSDVSGQGKNTASSTNIYGWSATYSASSTPALASSDPHALCTAIQTATQNYLNGNGTLADIGAAINASAAAGVKCAVLPNGTVTYIDCHDLAEIINQFLNSANGVTMGDIGAAVNATLSEGLQCSQGAVFTGDINGDGVTDCNDLEAITQLVLHDTTGRYTAADVQQEISILLRNQITCTNDAANSCTADTKVCSDGSTVGRDPQNSCLFKNCPSLSSSTVVSGCKTDVDCVSGSKCVVSGENAMIVGNASYVKQICVPACTNANPKAVYNTNQTAVDNFTNPTCYYLPTASAQSSSQSSSTPAASATVGCYTQYDCPNPNTYFCVPGMGGAIGACQAR